MKNKSKQYLKNYSPTILTGMAVIGFITTTVMAIKATPKAIDILKKCEDEKGEPLTKKEMIRPTLITYAPTLIVGVSTIICIISANTLNKKQQTSLISAYALLQDSFKKYKQAAKKVYGQDADIKIRAEMAEETMVYSIGAFSEICTYDPRNDNSDNMLFFDFYSKRYFNAKFAAVLNAEYHINRNLALGAVVSINDFYDFIGIEPIKDGDDVGWELYYIMEKNDSQWLDFLNEPTQMEDGMECCIITPIIDPVPISILYNNLNND